jgi:aminopeptidase-like protein
MQDAVNRELSAPDFAAEGERIYALAAELYPICRSITGDGVRQSLALMLRHIDIDVHEVPSGTRVLDWTVPKEWNIRAAHIKDAAGNTVVDFANSSLHVQSYSEPVAATMPLAELRKHLHTLPEQPDLVPYRTSYWAESWGFCLSHRQAAALPEGDYEVLIDSSLAEGSLTYGEHLHRGASAHEVLLTTHICHPSLANDNCSGLALLTMLARHLSGLSTRLSYRFLFSPGTIGPITWLARNEAGVGRIKHGLVVSGVGDGGGPTYKKSRRGDAAIDRTMAHVLRHAFAAPQIIDFEPYGYDERQFCSPGFDLPVGLLQRSRFGTFPQYHTSADNLDFIAPEHLAGSLEAVWRAIEILETDFTPLNLVPKGEPQLGRRGLYASTGGDKDGPARAMAYLWVLNQSDGSRTLLDIAERAGSPYRVVLAAARALIKAGLLAASDPGGLTPPVRPAAVLGRDVGDG